MSQPDDGRYKSRGRKERTPEQLKILAMAREKAKLVIQERTKIKKEMAEPGIHPSTKCQLRKSKSDPEEKHAKPSPNMLNK